MKETSPGSRLLWFSADPPGPDLTRHFIRGGETLFVEVSSLEEAVKEFLSHPLQLLLFDCDHHESHLNQLLEELGSIDHFHPGAVLFLAESGDHPRLGPDSLPFPLFHEVSRKPIPISSLRSAINWLDFLWRRESHLQTTLEERRRTTENLSASVSMLTHFVRQIPMAVAMFDGEMRYLATSEQWVSEYRLDGGDLIGRSHYEVFPEILEMPHWLEIHKRSLGGETLRNEKDRFVRLDGAEEWLRWELRPWFDESGKQGGIMMFTENITARILEENRRDQFFNLSVDILCVAGIDGFFKKVNPAAERILGYSSEELTSRPFFDFVHEEDLEATRKVLGRIEKGEPAIKFENRYRCKDGSIRWLQWNTTPLMTEGLLYGVARDVTARKEHEERQKALEAQMLQTQKLESLGVLAGGIAHDFNNLLMSILGNVDLALSEMSPVSPFRENLLEVEKASRRAADLCRQMLAYSGKGRFIVEPINLNEVVQEMTHMLEVSVSKKAILKYHFGHNLFPILADATQIRQVIMNLIINASEAIGELSGIISITTGMLECDRSYFEGAYLDEELPEGLYTYFEVADTGCGMDAETRKRIFDPFFTTKFTGRGLGLAAVLGIIRGHSGTLKVYSEEGKGSTFKILFPAIFDTPRPAESDTVPDTSWQGKGIVLLVDDEETVRVVGKKMLEKAGFRVLVANNGHEALEIFRSDWKHLVLVILDLTMPHLDGESTFREMRRISQEVPVIMSSGYNEQEVTQRFMGKGLAGFIQKPYTAQDLINKIRLLLDPNAEEITSPPSENSSNP